jgi:hypothetical protein
MENNIDRQFTAIRTMKDKIREKNNKQKKLKKKCQQIWVMKLKKIKMIDLVMK